MPEGKRYHDSDTFAGNAGIGGSVENGSKKTDPFHKTADKTIPGGGLIGAFGRAKRKQMRNKLDAAESQALGKKKKY